MGVPETLQKLRLAGMKVWMLTGDKQGTAVNIGYVQLFHLCRIHFLFVRWLLFEFFR